MVSSAGDLPSVGGVNSSGAGDIEISGVREIEGLGAKLHPRAFGNPKILEQRHIYFFKTTTPANIGSRVAERVIGRYGKISQDEIVV